MFNVEVLNLAIDHMLYYEDGELKLSLDPDLSEEDKRFYRELYQIFD